MWLETSVLCDVVDFGVGASAAMMLAKNPLQTGGQGSMMFASRMISTEALKPIDVYVAGFQAYD